MKILVAIKRTPHRDAKVKTASGGVLALENIEFEVNPFDELAVEEALRIRDAGDGEVIVTTVDGEASNRQLLSALAMGADRAIRVNSDEALDCLQIAKCLAAVVRREAPDLVLAGKLATDDESAQVPSMLAALLNWPQATQASKIELSPEPQTAKVVCEVDEGLAEIEIDLPAVITADLRLNEPRYASVPALLRAKKKPMEVIPLSDIPDPGATRTKVRGYRDLPPKPPAKTLKSVEELVSILVERDLI